MGREAPWQEMQHETMRQVSETMVTEETRKISSEHEIEPEHDDQKRDEKKSSSSSSSSSDDDDQEGVRSKEIKQHQYVEETTEIHEPVIEESEEDMAMRMRAAMSTSTPPSSPAVIRGEKLHAETSLAEAVVLAQHERSEEKRSRTSSASSHASSTSSKASSTKGYPVKEELEDDDEEISKEDEVSEEAGGLAQL